MTPRNNIENTIIAIEIIIIEYSDSIIPALDTVNNNAVLMSIHAGYSVTYFFHQDEK